MIGTDKQFWDILKGAIFCACFLVFVCLVCSSCKTLRSSKTNTKDSTSVSKTNTGSSKIDSSGSKSDKTNTKETVYYPQPIYIQGKDGETKVVFVPQKETQTGTEKNEDFSLQKESYWKEKYDSLMFAQLLSDKKSSTKVGFSTFEIIMMIAGGIIVLKMFTPSIIGFLTKK